jgi:hypothetical protein
MRTTRKSTSALVGRPPELEDPLAVIARVLTVSPVTGHLSPRRCVDVLTRSPFELGRLAKTLLRDALYEQRREAKVKVKVKVTVKVKVKVKTRQDTPSRQRRMAGSVREKSNLLPPIFGSVYRRGRMGA